MISRLSALAAFFAVVTTASLAYAATIVQNHHLVAQSTALEVVTLDRVVVTGHRDAATDTVSR